MKKAKDVDEYIANAPMEVQSKLRQLRKIIKECAPGAQEKISYGMPYYGYKPSLPAKAGKGRLAYFAYAKNHIGLYAMPTVLEGHQEEIKKYQTGKATLRFPLDQDLPISLIKKLIKAGIKNNEAKRK